MAIPLAAGLHASALREVVGVHNPEAFARAMRPLEVVHQSPDEVPAKGYPVGDRASRGIEVARQERDPSGIVHTIIDHDVVVRRAVLGDVELCGRVLVVKSHQQPSE